MSRMDEPANSVQFTIPWDGPLCPCVGMDPDIPGPQFCIFPIGHEGQHLSRDGARSTDPERGA